MSCAPSGLCCWEVVHRWLCIATARIASAIQHTYIGVVPVIDQRSWCYAWVPRVVALCLEVCVVLGCSMSALLHCV